ncbi:RAMP superfamily CRISPR-associated protein [Trichothermofontia sp.]
MTNTPRPNPRPNRPQRSQSSRRPNNPANGDLPPKKPYQLIPFPQEPPSLNPPAGQHKYLNDRLHGTLSLTLTVGTALHISTGITVMGSDIGRRLPLIKAMIQSPDQHLMIQGSSLKGCVRSTYEAITNSTLAVVTPKYCSKVPKNRLPCQNKNSLCPASQVFGALDWQGLVEFEDAKCESTEFGVGFMPSLYRPHGKVAGRKFYYHAIQAIDRGQNQGVPVQQAVKDYIFKTKIRFKNLTMAQLGTLLVVLGQDTNYPIALKVGAGKPIGMGTMTVTVEALNPISGQELRDRYRAYTVANGTTLTGQPLQTFMDQAIQTAHRELIQTPQLQQLAEVLRFPTDRTAPQGMY